MNINQSILDHLHEVSDMYNKISKIKGLENQDLLKHSEIVDTIQKRKNTIISKQIIKNFSLPQFQDSPNLIEDGDGIAGFTFRDHINPNNISYLKKKFGLDFNVSSRGVFFVKDQKIKFYEAGKQKITIFGFNEKGMWLRITIACEAYSQEERIALKKQEDKVPPFIKGNIELNAEAMGVGSLMEEYSGLEQYTGADEANKERINRDAICILKYMSEHIYRHAKKLQDKLQMAIKLLETCRLEELTIPTKKNED